MAKSNKKAKTVDAKAAAVSTSKRAGYKRKSNKRVNVLDAQLQRVARKAMKKAEFEQKKATKEVTV